MRKQQEHRARLRPAMTLAATLALPLTLLAVPAMAQVQSNAGTLSSPGLRIKQVRQDVVVDNQGHQTTTAASTLQVLNAGTVPQFSQVPVRFDASMEEAEILEAYTLKADGRKMAVDPGNIITQKAPQANALLPLYSDAEQKIIIFPNVEAGDSLVFTSRITEKKIPFEGQFNLSRYISTGIEADDAVFTITVPKSMHINMAYRDMAREVSNHGDQVTYKLSFTNLTAKAATPHLVYDPDTGPHFLFSSFKDYEDFAHFYAAMVRPKIVVTPEIQQQADAITAGISGKREQARAIYDWVNQHIRYVAIEFGVGGVVPHDANWTLSNGFGDCKDQAVLYASLLKAKGIAADPVLLNALTRYRLSGVPTASEFNHMITWLPEFKTYADTTATGTPFTMLPVMEYGKPVLHVVDTGPAGHTIPIMPPETTTSAYKVHAVMNSEGRFDVDVLTSATGPWAATLQQLSQRIDSTGRPQAAVNLLRAHGFANATGSLDPVINSSASAAVSIGGSFHTAAPVTGANIAVLARGLQLLNRAGDGPMGPLNAPTLADTEETPCYSGRQTEDIIFDFTNGAHLEQVPASIHLTTDNIVYDARWTVSGNTASLHREFTAKMSEPTCKGDVRQMTAQLLAKIRDEYAQPVRMVTK